MKRVLGYSDVWSVAPGAKICFKVSTYGPERYRADLVRVISGEDEIERGVFREEEIDAPFNGEHPGRLQPIDAYVIHAQVPRQVLGHALKEISRSAGAGLHQESEGVLDPLAVGDVLVEDAQPLR